MLQTPQFRRASPHTTILARTLTTNHNVLGPLCAFARARALSLSLSRCVCVCVCVCRTPGCNFSRLDGGSDTMQDCHRHRSDGAAAIRPFTGPDKPIFTYRQISVLLEGADLDDPALSKLMVETDDRGNPVAAGRMDWRKPGASQWYADFVIGLHTANDSNFNGVFIDGASSENAIENAIPPDSLTDFRAACSVSGRWLRASSLRQSISAPIVPISLSRPVQVRIPRKLITTLPPRLLRRHHCRRRHCHDAARPDRVKPDVLRR